MNVKGCLNRYHHGKINTIKYNKKEITVLVVSFILYINKLKYYYNNTILNKILFHYL